MTAIISRPICHGRKTWSHLTADSLRELEYYARRLRLEIHGGEYSPHGRTPHLDLDAHDRILALRYGTRMENDDDYE